MIVVDCGPEGDEGDRRDGWPRCTLRHHDITGQHSHDFVSTACGFDIRAQPNGLRFAPFADFGKAKAIELVDNALYTVGRANHQNANHLPPWLGGRCEGDLQGRVSQGRREEGLGHRKLLCCLMDHKVAPIPRL